MLAGRTAWQSGRGGDGQADAMTSVKALLAEAEELSVTFAVKATLPAAVGVPVIPPVAGLIATPLGRAPAVIDHVYGVAPPTAASVSE